MMGGGLMERYSALKVRLQADACVCVGVLTMCDLGGLMLDEVCDAPQVQQSSLSDSRSA